MIDLEPIQACALNPIDPAVRSAGKLAGVIGAAPSRYSKSPALWNAAFQALRMNAVYIALDLDETRLAALMAAARRSHDVLGFNVTVPHKVAVVKHLDALDESARRIGAVNTIVRMPSGELVGANTDGAGFIETLLTAGPGAASPLLRSLDGIDTLMLGAGGSARAVAFALAEKLGEGKLLIANRSHENARALARDLAKYHRQASAIREDEIAAAAPRAKLIVNCTTKGQGGMDPGGRSLEAYSALAPAAPTSPGKAGGTIEKNHSISLDIARSVPADAVFYDLIYHPEETVFLRHARQTGHRAVNGRGMIVAQAVEAFFNHVCRRELEAARRHTPETRRRLSEIMNAAWTEPTNPKL